MKEFLDLQKQLQSFILEEPSYINEFIVQTKHISEEARLEIYKEAYQLRLAESLRTSFPALHVYLGTEVFNELAFRYIKKHPSSYRSIRWFGDKFASFVRHAHSSNYSFLAELAGFEWSMALAFDAKDINAVKIEDMAHVSPELWASMTFTMHSSVQRINYSWNTVSLWQALMRDEELPPMHQQEKECPWILWRDSHYKINFYSLGEEEAWALDTIIQGSNFETLCEGLCEWLSPEEVGLKAATYLKHWIQKEMISELVLV